MQREQVEESEVEEEGVGGVARTWRFKLQAGATPSVLCFGSAPSVASA